MRLMPFFKPLMNTAISETVKTADSIKVSDRILLLTEMPSVPMLYAKTAATEERIPKNIQFLLPECDFCVKTRIIPAAIRAIHIILI